VPKGRQGSKAHGEKSWLIKISLKLRKRKDKPDLPNRLKALFFKNPIRKIRSFKKTRGGHPLKGKSQDKNLSPY